MSSTARNVWAGMVLGMLGVVAGCVMTHLADLAQAQEQQALEVLAEDEIVSALESAGLVEIIVGQDSEHERAQCLQNNGQYRAFTARRAAGEESVLGNVCVTTPIPSTGST